MMNRSDLIQLVDCLDGIAKDLSSIQEVLTSANAKENHDYDEHWTRNVVAVCSLAMGRLIPALQAAHDLIRKDLMTERQKDAAK